MMKKQTKLVTRDSLRDMLAQAERNADDNRKAVIIGRALIVVFKNQERSEQSSNSTSLHNGVGFAPMDAFGGSLTAKSFIKNKTLLPWQVAKWMKIGKSGYPRICKYHSQLNAAALVKCNNV